MYVVWQRMERIASDGGQLVDWLIVHMFYSTADFTMLNTVNLGRFVTLTLTKFVTPKQLFHWLVVDSKRNVFQFNTW